MEITIERADDLEITLPESTNGEHGLVPFKVSGPAHTLALLQRGERSQ
jgi:hypothetical protein